MREILFRGKRKNNGEWVYGGFTLDAIDCPRITVKDGEGLLFPEVIPETVGQYTGLTDKNSKKIFEGDVIEYFDDCGYIYTAPVVWGGESYPAFDIEDEIFECANSIVELLDDGDANVKVIGNIHDNPELLGAERGGVNVNKTEGEYIEMVEADGTAICDVPYKRRTLKVCLAAVKQNRIALHFVPVEMRREEVCLAAVQADGYSLIDVPKAWRTEAICLAAVRKDGGALMFVPDELRTTELCVEAVQQHKNAFPYVPEGLRAEVDSRLKEEVGDE
jgi:uncharacterized phage protein (TIGR01671 family)